ncbi:chalcone isomerase family protein [Polynucleobacter sp. AP-Capit-er-40B-B4]|uniref:chalcone isomerase family protein n=1 Tax=Polynucleobacter sp. AP-Capit-er-40B-B4 TaxID=2576927 RepID=UPI001C0C089D|nr:chalcone isomerase family protein [Polynucleobacter sp. AP-Capit-er-40B-B4]MBU3581606.1 chalcone isomerase family protein [Polynucleobacter sp. AP-Capit-er-40B-B4]
MKKMPLFLALTFLAVFLSNSFAREPIELPPNISAAKLQGSGRLTWFGLHVYDAAFYRVGSLSSPDFALNLRYQKSFSGASIANRSAEEMKRIGVPEAQAALWGKELTAFLPNVESGQTLTAIYSPKQGTTFYHDGKQIAQVPGIEFSKAFFGIWLDPKTSAPKLRTELLGQSCPPPIFNEAC